MNDWIAVTDRLPAPQDAPYAVPVLTYSAEDDTVTAAHFYCGHFYYYGEWCDEYGLLLDDLGLTHWMPFPPPPTA